MTKRESKYSKFSPNAKPRTVYGEIRKETLDSEYQSVKDLKISKQRMTFEK